MNKYTEALRSIMHLEGREKSDLRFVADSAGDVYRDLSIPIQLIQLYSGDAIPATYVDPCGTVCYLQLPIY